MFEAKLGNAAVMKKIVDAIKDLLNEVQFDCTENAITLQAMDSSHVALVTLRLNSTGFETYRCDRSTNLGMNLTHFAKIVKCAGNDDTLCLRFQDDADTVTMLFENHSLDRQSEYELKLMDMDNEHLGIPEQDYNCVVTLPAGEFQRICRDLAQFGDSLSVAATKSDIMFSTKGEIGSGKIRLCQTASTDDDKRKVEILVKEPVNINFAVKYLNHFTKATPLSSTVTLSMSNDVPIVVEYPIYSTTAEEDEDAKEDKKKARASKSGAVEEIGHIRFYLAPKVDDDDNMS